MDGGEEKMALCVVSKTSERRIHREGENKDNTKRPKEMEGTYSRISFSVVLHNSDLHFVLHWICKINICEMEQTES